MKTFNRKFLILAIFVCIILISVYYFTKDEDYEFSSQNEFYISTNFTTPELSEIIVHIDGQVANPGVVHLSTKSRIEDAIVAGGGLTDLADISKINLAYVLKDGQKVYIPSIYDIEDIPYIQDTAGNNVIVPDISPNSTLININSATQTELESLPGIGPSTASKIIDYRNKNGEFETIEELLEISGIGEAKFNSIKDLICI